MVTLKENFVDTLSIPKDMEITDTERRILNKVLKEPITRKDLCDHFKMAWTTMYDHLNDLEKMKYIKRLPLRDGSRGSPKKYWMAKNYPEEDFQKGSVIGKIMAILDDEEYHSYSEIVEKLNVLKATASIYLNKLLRNKNVKIEKYERDGHCYWKITPKLNNDK